MTWNNPVSVTYGIRHKKLFGVLRRGGDAIDAVLPLQGTGNVPRRSLTRIGWPDPLSARITNEDEDYALTINAEGIVLTVDLQNIRFTHVNVRDMFQDIVDVALPILTLDYNRNHVNRIGIVETYDFATPGPGELLATSLTPSLTDLGRPWDFALRAAFRTYGNRESDWWNTIIQVAAAKSDEEAQENDRIRVSIDYQLHVVPERMLTRRMIQTHYARFFEEAERVQRNQLAWVVEAGATTVHG
jgi:hypothetical protein